MDLKKKILTLVIVALVSLSFIPILAGSPTPGKLLDEKTSNAPAASTAGTFAYESYFESGGTYSNYGWSLSGNGQPPTITSSVNYSGEPSLRVSGGETLSTSSGIIPGNQFISFQAAVDASSGMAVFSIVNSNGKQVAGVGISGNQIYAGGSSLSSIGTAPSNTVYPAGWTYISGNIQNTSTQKSFSWTMQLFVDQTDMVFANVSVPGAYQYAGLQIGSNSGKVYFTDIVLSTYEIPIYSPGYNPMEGYGQGSGLIVSLLHPFTILHASMILNSWNVPESGILSFQINAMNYYGTTTSSCVGFFQLGVDINPNGMISPWYVPGKNCIAHYFLNSSNPSAQAGFKSPPGSMLSLSIVDQPANDTIFFQIIDHSVTQSSGDRYWNATIPYSGTEFYGTYTQLEFQPSSSYPIQNYFFSGSLYNMGYGNSFSSLAPLNASYMLPFTLNAPTTWSFTYYNNAASGYNQIG